MSVDLRHMVKPSTFSGARGNQNFCVESRDPQTGELVLNTKLPFMEATQWELIKYFFNHSNLQKAAQDVICKWYNDQGIYFRLKTW